jgi:hypothetical protein
MEVGHQMFFNTFKFFSVVTANLSLQKGTVRLA